MKDERIAVHMTGCPNGCARPYSPDIGLVGKARGKYTLYIGGNLVGSRIGFIFKDMVPLEDIGLTVAPLLSYFKAERQSGETFGEVCARNGLADLSAFAEKLAHMRFPPDDMHSASICDHIGRYLLGRFGHA